MTDRRRTLEPAASAAVSILLRKAQARLQAQGERWSYERIAEVASAKLREYSASGTATDVERELWSDLEVSYAQVRTLMDCPANPTGTAERRAVLLGVCLTLNVDRRAMNRHAGGIPC